MHTKGIDNKRTKSCGLPEINEPRLPPRRSRTSTCGREEFMWGGHQELSGPWPTDKQGRSTVTCLYLDVLVGDLTAGEYSIISCRFRVRGLHSAAHTLITELSWYCLFQRKALARFRAWSLAWGHVD
eukprot:TRINITY_DN17473_c1_g1_i1.p3 TRINITY_DN17473_c1_g1~~TRINITY_DN17473_c1_g1_i1.p3  ORF type:complete len:127 (+),score=6.59 TRINITY_DN17473_c1_g1_i1:1324-1704(+)